MFHLISWFIDANTCIFSILINCTLNPNRGWGGAQCSGAILGGRGHFSSGGDYDLKTAFYGLLPVYMNYKQLPEVSVDIKTIFVRPEIRSGRPFKVYAQYPFLGDRGYFSTGGDFNLKTAFYGLLPLCMNYKQLPEVYADVKPIFVRPENRSGCPFKVYAHYPFLGYYRGYFGSCTKIVKQR